MDPVSEPPAIIEFGRFRILPHRRELLVDGQPIRIGGRAFDVLLALIEARPLVSAATAAARVRCVANTQVVGVPTLFSGAW